MKTLKSLFATSLLSLLALSACTIEINDPDQPLPETETSFTVTIENISAKPFLASGAQPVAEGATDPGPIGPGGAYEVSFHAPPGMRLSFAAMFVQSNDLFYAPNEDGIALFDEAGTPLSGDITEQVELWDAGSEINEEPGVGLYQAPRQDGMNSGDPDPDNTVRLASDDFNNLPTVADAISVTLTPGEGNMFTLRLENVSAPGALSTSQGNTDIVVAPIAWVLHNEPAPLFSVGSPDRGEGLEMLAEDGGPGELVASLSERTGLTTPFAPGVFIVHDSGEPLFSADAADRGEGLEALAEDGDPSALAEAIAGNDITSGVFNTPVDASEPGPLLPSGSYQFSFDASPGDYLSFASMLVQSNDLFIAPEARGLSLFNADGTPLSGDITADVLLWNAGTEVDEAPGAGPNQAPRQDGPDTGADEGGTVSIIDDLAVTDLVRVTITAN